MKKKTLAVCLLILALGVSGCKVSVNDLPKQISDLHNLITNTPTEDTVVDTTEEEPKEVATAEPEVKDETLAEAGDRLDADKETEAEAAKPAATAQTLEEILKENQETFTKGVADRLLSYVVMDTTCDSKSDTAPSTASELVFAQTLAAELQRVGVSDAAVDDYGYVYGTIPANVENEPVIGLIAHMDTTEDVPGKDIKPKTIENYDGGDITMTGNGKVLSAKTYSDMKAFTGDTIVVSDGTTLLGADDKAGIAEIMTLAEFLNNHPEIAHGAIRIAFLPDEEMDAGTEFFNIENFGATYAYDLDGDRIEDGARYETFNKAVAKITITGQDTYAGNAKGIMKNALSIGAEFSAMLPDETPGNTSEYEGYYYVKDLSGSVGKATIELEICDFDNTKYESRKTMVTSIANYLNGRYGNGTVEVTMEDRAANMANPIGANWNIVSNVLDVMGDLGYEKKTTPFRGTSDGAALTVQGLPTPILPTGVANRETVYECVSVNEMCDVVNLLVNLVVPAE